MAEREAENRQRISEGVISAIRSKNTPPAIATLVEAVMRGEENTVIFGPDTVEALFRSRVLLLSGMTSGDLDAPGWKHIEKRINPPTFPWMEPTTERELRVMSYYLTEPGLTYLLDSGGHYTLEAVRQNHQIDYRLWELKWEPKHSMFNKYFKAVTPPPKTHSTPITPRVVNNPDVSTRPVLPLQSAPSQSELQAVTYGGSTEKSSLSLVMAFTEIPAGLVEIAKRIDRRLQGLNFEDRKALLVYSAWEKNPSSESMAKIAAALGISKKELNALNDRVIEDERFEKYLSKL